jgi:dihydrofolate synthase/folylpolyglutamate synthase
MATICLQTKLPVTDSACAEGIKNTFLAGRQQLSAKHCQIIFDVAHNPQAAEYLARHLSNFNKNAKIHAVFSAMADKDISGLVSPLKTIVDRWYPAVFSGKRAASATQLLDALKANDVNEILCYNDPLLAFDVACSQASADDLIVVYGSFIIVGQILSTLYNPIPSRR